MELHYFNQQGFYQSLQQFFEETNIPVNYVTKTPTTAQEILVNTYKPNNQAHQLIEDVYFLGMVDDAVFHRKSSRITAENLRKKYYEGLLIFGITLNHNGKLPTRSQMAEITRAFNREFHYTPVVTIFKYEQYLSFASCERLPYKQTWREGEKTGKVSILKDVHVEDPHTGHRKTLDNLKIQRTGKQAITSFDELYNYWQEVFSVSLLNKSFYRELSNWYFWALQHVEFPDDAEKDRDIRNAASVIRLITRLIFVWFLKEKFLIPNELFDKQVLDGYLKYEDATGSTYYKAILQNLFFATLNTEMQKDNPKSRQFVNRRYGIQGFYRYSRFFQDETKALKLFKGIPFLNGGLFENPNRNVGQTDETRLKVPDFLFFGDEEEIDLSQIYDDKKRGHEKVRGLLNILNSYKFTIAENTPIEEEIALDPELLGRVFENLLASYNPETQTTARKQTGSFYTPREIVNYMADESLIEYFLNAFQHASDTEGSAENIETRLRHLFSYAHEPHQFTREELRRLIYAIDNAKILDPACGSGAFPMGILHKIVHLLSKLDPNNAEWKHRQIEKIEKMMQEAEHIQDTRIREQVLEDLERHIESIEDAFQNNELDYGRKLYLIENCIYGVDIQPIAVQIAKLRFFISLIVDQKVNPEKENLGVRPLPNLETKFVAANALIGIETPQQMTLRNPEIDKREAELKQVRQKHFDARTPKTKENYHNEDERLRTEIAELLRKDGFPSDVTEQLACWNPYGQNASAEFFDPEWMFGITEGFDVVLGNPPYVRIQKFERGQKALWEKQHYQTYTATGDVYCLFYEKGVELLKQHGILSYISSNKWMRANYGKSMRKYLLEHVNILQLIDFGDAPIFENATTYTDIVVLEKESPQREPKVHDLSHKVDLNLSLSDNLGKYDMYTSDFSENAYLIIDGTEAQIKHRIEEVGTPLEDWQIQIFRGILTGYNRTFIIDRKTKDLLIQQDQKNAEIIQPVLRGKDIKKYKVDFTDSWLINTHNGIKAGNIPRIDVEKDYPTIYEYLKTFRNQLMTRQDKGDHWTNLRNCAYLQELEKEKIIFAEIVYDAAFYYDTNHTYVEATGFLMTGEHLKYLLALLNSKPVTYFFRRFYAGGDLRGNTLRYKKAFLNNLPLPKIPEPEQQPFEVLADYLLFLKRESDAQVGLMPMYFERVINGMVYELYFEDRLKQADLDIRRYLQNLPVLSETMTDQKKMKLVTAVFKEISHKEHPVCANLYFLDTIDEVRMIEKAWIRMV